MGRELGEKFPCAQRVFEEADRALGFPLSKLCFEGPPEQLQLTANTQPAILTVSVAAAEVLREKGIRADFLAGHSLGEYSALVVAGAIRISASAGAACKRGRHSSHAGPPAEGCV